MVKKYKTLGVIGAVLLVLLAAPSTLGQTTTGGEDKPTPNLIIIGWTYIWWDPSYIYPGSITFLNAGMDVIALGAPFKYSIRVVIYDPYPVTNGGPVLVSHTLVGCRPGPGFSFEYDPARRAWVFYSGICTSTRTGYDSLRITARWRPREPGIYMAEITSCLHELPTSCASSRAMLIVFGRWR